VEALAAALDALRELRSQVVLSTESSKPTTN
jgi:hypothetical protein